MTAVATVTLTPSDAESEGSDAPLMALAALLAAELLDAAMVVVATTAPRVRRMLSAMSSAWMPLSMLARFILNTDCAASLNAAAPMSNVNSAVTSGGSSLARSRCGGHCSSAPGAWPTLPTGPGELGPPAAASEAAEADGSIMGAAETAVSVSTQSRTSRITTGMPRRLRGASAVLAAQRGRSCLPCMPSCMHEQRSLQRGPQGLGGWARVALLSRSEVKSRCTIFPVVAARGRIVVCSAASLQSSTAVASAVPRRHRAPLWRSPSSTCLIGFRPAPGA